MVTEHVDTSTVTALSVCSGFGGIELGLQLVIPGLRAIAFVERDIVPARILAKRMEEGTFEPAPIWSDVTTFDGRRWAGSVDFVMGGFPCQPFSVAGKRKGLDDERWIWPDIARVIREVRPAIVFLENVPGLVRHGLSYVLADLAAAGFDAEWDVFSAAGVGAPHKRERVFVLAHASGERCEESERGPAPFTDAGCADVGHAAFITEREARDRVGGTGGRLFPPGPADRDGWREYIAAGGPQPTICRGADGSAGRNDRLFACGNGVVPLAVAHAFVTLAARLGIELP